MSNVNINRKIITGSAPYVFSLQSLALFSQFGATQPSLADKIQIDKLMRVIVSLPIDIFYNLALSVSPVNVPKLFNWITPGSFTLTADGTSMTIDAYQGYTGNPAGLSIFKTGWNPATNGVNYTLNAASTFSYVRTTPTNINGAALGVQNSGGAGGYTTIYPRFTTGVTRGYTNINNVSGVFDFTPASHYGFIAAQVNSNTQDEVFKNGISQGTAVTAHSFIPSFELYLFGLNNAGTKQSYFDGQCAMFGAGGKMTSDQHLTLSNACNAYMSYYSTNVY